MNYPLFFKQVPTITLQDNLAQFLGTFEDGVVEFSYLDIVKSAGHSCPTVAGAYLMTLNGLQTLYPNELPKRGEIIIEFKENQNSGVAGVIGAVIANITGATTDYGFAGINGKFNRKSLMFFEREISSNARFTRVDTQESVDIFYDASSVKPDERQASLMKKLISDKATQEERALFAKLWQKRVEDIFANAQNVIKVQTVYK